MCNAESVIPCGNPPFLHLFWLFMSEEIISVVDPLVGLFMSEEIISVVDPLVDKEGRQET